MRKITERQALEAMALFVSRYYERAGNDIETLLSDITGYGEGLTSDPAAWDDWIDCVRTIVDGAAD